MAEHLTRHLENKGIEHSELEMLVSQWGFDKLLIPKALQNVGSLFPHFSRHDESHSRRILINIERILGDNLSLLSATDTWLILEAAYWHDIGMIVERGDIERALSTQEFQDYLDTIRLASNHELKKFARAFDPGNMSKCFSGADTPMDAVSKFQQMMAEWFRRKHQSRSESIVQEPWIRSGISSPRTELIPTRLFRLLGRICHMHGLPFKDIIAKNGLPFREAGLGQDDCHPRYIACLLRIGDLLDLDDNRFCPVMQRIAGDSKPNLTKAHEDKHASMRHIRIDRERIEVSAECESIDGYLETFKWFEWLRDEISNQMANWQTIAPNRLLGLLPTLGEMSVSLSGNLQIIKEGVRPQFSVDGVKAIGILQGEGLYSSRFSGIRELLQNATDATLLKLWLMRDKGDDEELRSNPFSAAAKGLLATSMISINLAELQSIATDLPNSMWRLVITDGGTGISRDDLTYMLRIGGSQENTSRQLMINSMPEWMKPSGAFGIGFQSIFMICDDVTIISKNIFDGQTIEIKFYNPMGEKEGLVLIKTVSNDLARPTGTVVQLDLSMDKFAKNWTWSPHKDSIASEYMKVMDPILDTHFPFDAASIADKIKEFAQHSIIDIDGQLKSLMPQKEITIRKTMIEPDHEKRLTFVKVEDYELVLYYGLDVSSRAIYGVNSAYRNQAFENTMRFIPYAEVYVNILSGKAGIWLTANRDKLNNNARRFFHDMVLKALEKQVEYDLDHQEAIKPLVLENRIAYSRFLEGMSALYGGKWLDFSRAFGDWWLDLNFFGSDVTYRSFFQGEGGVVTLAPYAGEVSLTDAVYLIDNASGDLGMFIFLKAWLLERSRSARATSIPVTETMSTTQEVDLSPIEITSRHFKKERRYRIFYDLRKGPQSAYTEDALAARLAKEARSGSENQRFLLECEGRWSALSLKGSLTLTAERLFDIPRPECKYMLLPFLFRRADFKALSSPEMLIALCSWLQSRLDVIIPVEDIRSLYEELIDDIDNRVMKDSEFWEIWRNARGL